MTVDELAQRTGVSVRNIRAYQTAGLMPPPALQGRLGLYSQRHQSRLELIRELRSMGFGLDAIGDMLDRIPKGAGAQYSLMAQMFSNGFFQVEQPERKTLPELTAHWGEHATQEQMDRLLQSGLYRALASPSSDVDATQAEFEMLSPSLWNIGKQLAELNIPLDTVLDMQDNLIRHTRAIARGYVDQFVIAMVREVTQSGLGESAMTDEHGNPTLPPALLRTVRDVIERLRPLAIGSVSAAFPVVLQQEFDRDVLDRIHKRLKQQSRPKSTRQPE
jgi:DNA-binding transcriptional MerR regulator